jgi:two-component system KDP operon response regulator KdpE
VTDPTKILVVDDEVEIRKLLNVFLSVEDFEVSEAETGKSAIRHIVSAKPDLIILDLGLPDMDGQEILRSVRQASQVPILVLSARSDDADVVAALNAGADDYVTKPFRVENLLARIRANLRDRRLRVTKDIVENGPIVLDRTRHEVRINGILVMFTPKEFDILDMFLRNIGRVLTHKQILQEVWGPQHREDTQYLRVYIGQMRLKLEAFPALSKLIIAEPRIGYRMASLALPAPSVAA